MSNATLNKRNSMHGWYFEPSVLKSAVRERVMINPSLDLTNACNLNCPYCYIEEKGSSRKKRLPLELTFEETEQVVRAFHFLGAQTINLVGGGGEPTIDPDFEEVVRLNHSLDITTILFTNGIRLASNPDMVKFLWDHDVTVVLKVNSLNSNRQDLLGGRYGYSQKRDKALQLLLESGFNEPIPTRLSVNMVVMKDNVKEIVDLHIWCRENNIYPMAGDYIPTGRTLDGAFQGFASLEVFTDPEKEKVTKMLQPPTPSERTELLRSLVEVDRRFGIQRDACPAYYGGSVYTQVLGIYVDILGRVWPCVARSKVEDGVLNDGLLANVRECGDLEVREVVQQAWLHSYLEQLRSTYNGGCPYKVALK